jgi:hypothetical protein
MLPAAHAIEQYSVEHAVKLAAMPIDEEVLQKLCSGSNCFVVW